MLQKLKKQESGFSIVEVMIVLAIAGLIILVVFLAVPALQRNARNTTARNDAGNLAGLVGEYRSANNGAIPAPATLTVSATTGEVTAGSATAKVQNLSTVTVVAGSAARTPTLTAAFINTGVKCPAGSVAGTSLTPLAATSRSAVIVYGVETSSGVVASCIEA